MHDAELWRYMLKKKVAQTKPFDRTFVWIRRHDFLKVKNFFIREYNLLHTGASFRSANYLLHIHAVEQGNYFFVHRDFGNLAKFFPLGLLHLFVDHIPFLLFCWLQGRSLKSFLAMPAKKD